jgi:hypothetical protein
VDFNKLIARVKGILLTPKTEWPVIAGEQTTVADLYKGYILWLAAIPAVFSFLAGARFFPGTALAQAALSYALSLGVLYVMALITDALAPNFGGTRDRVQGLKTVAYAATASYVAGVAAILPWSLAALVGIAALVYGIYLLYLGLPQTMKCPPDRAGSYTAVLVLIMIVAFFVMGALVAAVTGGGMYMRGASPFTSSRDSSGTIFDKDSTVGKLEQWSRKVEDAGKKMEAAQKSGDQQAQSDAMKDMVGAALGGGAIESLSPDRLQPFLPESLGDMSRSTFSTERNSAMGMQMTEARATYMNENGRSWDLQITDVGSAKSLLALAGWAGIEGENETSSGYDKTYREDGRLIHEQWDRGSSRGQYGLVLGERFTIKIEGEADSIDDLKAAIADLDLEALEAMKDEGVAQN